MKKTKPQPKMENQAAADRKTRSIRHARRQVIKAVAGAVIGGVIAGPVGVAAGAIVGASVRRGPVKKKNKPVVKANSSVKSKAPRKRHVTKPRFTDIYPNIP